MSKLKEVMEMFELEDMEEFEVEENRLKYRFNLEKNELQYNNFANKWLDGSFELVDLINGTLTIKKEWKPKCRENVWIVDFEEKENVYDIFWANRNWKQELLEKGLIFKTKEEAMEAANKMLEVLK